MRRRRDFVNRYPVELVNIQHEYGLFGGERGEWLVDFMRLLEKPVVLTLHTVLPEPDERMLRVTRELCEHAAQVVALSETGRGLLEAIYGIDPQRLQVIHHGVPDVPFQDTHCGEGLLRHRPAHGDLDLRTDQPRQRTRVRDRGDARASSGAIPRRSI